MLLFRYCPTIPCNFKCTFFLILSFPIFLHVRLNSLYFHLSPFTIPLTFPLTYSCSVSSDVPPSTNDHGLLTMNKYSGPLSLIFLKNIFSAVLLSWPSLLCKEKIFYICNRCNILCMNIHHNKYARTLSIITAISSINSLIIPYDKDPLLSSQEKQSLQKVVTKEPGYGWRHVLPNADWRRSPKWAIMISQEKIDGIYTYKLFKYFYSTKNLFWNIRMLNVWLHRVYAVLVNVDNICGGK